MSDPNEPLRVKVKQGRLVISIGVQTLAFAVENGSAFEVYVGEEYVGPKIMDRAAFARAVAVELKREDEDGSTLLTKMLDEAAELAMESGLDCVELPEVA